MKVTIRLPALTGALAVAMAVAAHADEGNPKAVWGGGPAESSAYTANYVPKVIEVLDSQHLTGYAWGGVSQGTVANAELVTDHPTNLAVGQSDIFGLIKDQPITGREGAKYQFTIVKPDMGPECLYLISSDKSYKTFGDVVGNGWQLGVVTGGEKSGSFGTWKVLQGLYPDLKPMAVTHVAAISDIVAAVKQKKDMVGFFVMRPDPDSEVFKTIAEASLTIVPVVDFDLEDKYKFMSLKVSHGWSGGKEVQTACTTVALITGDPSNAKLANDSDKKRLAETIKRMGAVDSKAFQPDASSWRDMWDSIASYSTDEAKSLMDQSRKAIADLKKAHGG
jgi:hypothetical protein